MKNLEQHRRAQWVLDQVGEQNPYNRQGENNTEQYYIYQAGFLAAYLASLMREDPFIQKRFLRHLQRLQQGPAA